MFLPSLKYVLNSNIILEKRLMMSSVLFIWFITSIISMNYISPNGIFQSILLAYLFGRKNIYSFKKKYIETMKILVIDNSSVVKKNNSYYYE
jgi:hypothetical protein